MSSPLAIAAVSAVLRDLLNDGLINNDITGALGSNVDVTVVPPDSIKIDEVNASTQLNIFLHQATPNAAWRNADLPSRSARGGRISNAPLALDLHYLITAYGASPLHAEVLLGYAMHLLHETPVLDRQAIRGALSGAAVDGSILPPAFQALSAADIADQVEQIKLTPITLSTEEMSKLWSALQAHYRPTAAYQASVVLVEARRPGVSPLPVLTRGPRDPVSGRERGVVTEPGLLAPFPTLTAIEPPNRQPAARLGDAIVLRGHHLDGTNVRVRFEHGRRATPIEITIGTNAHAERLGVTLPATLAASVDWPPGSWTVAVLLQRPGETQVRTSNSMPLLLAPRIDVAASSAARNPATGAVTVQLTFSPQARPRQDASLVVGGSEAMAAPIAAQTASLPFVFPSLAAGTHWLRLRIDGVDSLLVNRSVTPPTFTPGEQMVIPP